jgi:hypothetical protein
MAPYNYPVYPSYQQMWYYSPTHIIHPQTSIPIRLYFTLFQRHAYQSAGQALHTSAYAQN